MPDITVSVEVLLGVDVGAALAIQSNQSADSDR